MEEIDLMKLLKMFWKEKIVLILIIVFFIEAGVIYSFHYVKPVYTSSTKLVLASTNSSGTSATNLDTATITTTDITINSKLVSTYSEIVKSKNIIRQVIENLNLDIDEETLKSKINVNSVKNTELIEITVTDPDPERAKVIANEIANVFIDTVKDIYKIENVYVLDKAEVETEPSNINHTKDIALFGAGGLILAVLYVFLINLLDTTIKTPEEIEQEFKVYVLAAIPEYKGGNK